MSKTLYTSLVGRTVTPIPSGSSHSRDDLPQKASYLIHTVYLDEGEPVALTELIANSNPDNKVPEAAKLFISHIGLLWRLI